MKKSFFKTLLLAVCCIFSMSACGGDNNDNSGSGTGSGDGKNDKPTTETTGFAKGADVSWLTEMEHDGKKFYNAQGQQQECMALLKSLGMNAIRLRVWVSPDGGWCGKDDVLAKAERASKLGMRLMIDFHYSDSWADPSHQTPPAAWQNYTAAQMQKAVAQHTTDVLSALKAKGIGVEWVQVGNETRDGMLWNDGTTAQAKAVTGRASANAANYAAYTLAGYNAVKAVYPDAKVVVHVDQGENQGGFTWLFDLLKKNGAKWDVIGMSFYPDDSKWQTQTDQCLANIKTLATRYSCPVVVSETGMAWDSSQAASMLKKFVDGCKAISNCEGVFYWEPEQYNYWKPANYTTLGWNAYNKGAFDKSGKPTAALDAFK